MIYTRFGSPVELVSKIDEQGWVHVLVEHADQEIEREYHISELKADGGLEEIHRASDELPESPEV